MLAVYLFRHLGDRQFYIVLRSMKRQIVRKSFVVYQRHFFPVIQRVCILHLVHSLHLPGYHFELSEYFGMFTDLVELQNIYELCHSYSPYSLT